jgi:hypothetical protein
MSKLLKSDFNHHRASKNVWFISLPDTCTEKDLLNPSFYAHVAERIRPQDTIEVVSKGNAFYAELFVLSADKNSVKVSILRWVDFKENGEEYDISTDYKVRYVANFGYQVVRVSDKKSMNETGFGTKKEAAAYIASLAA